MLSRLSSKNIFLVDGIGAVVSVFSLGVLLVKFELIFGMPIGILYILASIALLFAIYSLTIHFLKPINWKLYLKFIAIANGSYCLLTAGFVIDFMNQLTALGMAYFIGEMMLIITLVRVEFKLIIA